MANLPDIFCIHEPDADLHFQRLRQISNKFIGEGRVGAFIPLLGDAAITSLPQRVKEKDLVIILLTDQLVARRVALKDVLEVAKRKHTNVVIAEIIVDNLQYDKDYISWPSDLTPIRSRADMDSAWAAIESNLNEIIPRRNVIPWKTIAAVAAGVLLVALLVWLLPRVFNSKEKPSFSLKIMDSQSGRIHTDTSACYLPCIAVLSSTSPDFDSLIWNISDTDTTIAMEKEYSYLFAIPGEHVIKLTAVDGGRKESVSRSLVVKAPLVADFIAENDGCQAPCEIQFRNKSGDGELKWDFAGINQSSTDENPEMKYETPGEYNVALTVVNEDGLRSDTVKKVTIKQDDSPFAEFSTTTVGSPLSRTVRFVNASKNSNEYIWKFGDGSSPITAVSPIHTFPLNGYYEVELIAKRGNETNATSKKIRVGRFIGGFDHIREEIEANPQLKAQVRRLQNLPQNP